jgi:hypothetical protein
MTRATATALIMQRLGKRTGLDANVIVELQQAQQDLETGEFLPWFLKKALDGLATTAGARSVALPGDFIRETDEKWWLGAADGVKRLHKGGYDELYERELFDSDYSSSYYYAIVGTSMYHFPTPASVMSITGFYFAQAVMLTTEETENTWLKYASSVLVAKAGMRIAKTVRDAEAFGLFKEDYAEAYNKLIAADTAREQAAYNAVMGG